MNPVFLACPPSNKALRPDLGQDCEVRQVHGLSSLPRRVCDAFDGRSSRGSLPLDRRRRFGAHRHPPRSQVVEQILLQEQDPLLFRNVRNLTQCHPAPEGLLIASQVCRSLRKCHDVAHDEELRPTDGDGKIRGEGCGRNASAACRAPIFSGRGEALLPAAQSLDTAAGEVPVCAPLPLGVERACGLLAPQGWRDAVELLGR